MFSWQLPGPPPEWSAATGRRNSGHYDAESGRVRLTAQPRGLAGRRPFPKIAPGNGSAAVHRTSTVTSRAPDLTTEPKELQPAASFISNGHHTPPVSFQADGPAIRKKRE
jgi:hypothetical protein